MPDQPLITEDVVRSIIERRLNDADQELRWIENEAHELNAALDIIDAADTPLDEVREDLEEQLEALSGRRQDMEDNRALLLDRLQNAADVARLREQLARALDRLNRLTESRES